METESSNRVKLYWSKKSSLPTVTFLEILLFIKQLKNMLSKHCDCTYMKADTKYFMLEALNCVTIGKCIDGVEHNNNNS